jgi:hypothetical protein
VRTIPYSIRISHDSAQLVQNYIAKSMAIR